MNRVAVACVALWALAGGAAGAADLPPYYQPGPAYNPIYTMDRLLRRYQRRRRLGQFPVGRRE